MAAMARRVAFGRTQRLRFDRMHRGADQSGMPTPILISESLSLRDCAVTIEKKYGANSRSGRPQNRLETNPCMPRSMPLPLAALRRHVRG